MNTCFYAKYFLPDIKDLKYLTKHLKYLIFILNKTFASEFSQVELFCVRV